MTTENGVNSADAKRIELKSGLADPVERRQSGFVVTASVLIGLGAGMLVDHVWAGCLIGLGLGFVGAELIARFGKPLESGQMHKERMNVTMVLIGAFLAYLGISIVWAPVAIWPYAAAGFLILIGVSLLVRGFHQSC
jgi:hypothetical protein